MQSIEIYSATCRKILKEGGASYSKWFFDERGEIPNFAFLHSFELSSVSWSVHDYLIYFEIHLDLEKNEGVFSICTLEVGPTLVRSPASQSQSKISNGSNSITFETSDNKHHLKGSVKICRNENGSFSGFLSVEFSLSLIHPGTKQTTNIVNLSKSLENPQVEITCPKCLGKGEYNNMAIPEASFKSGLNGYALYSENTVCSQTGCPLCGGSGTSYEEWYAKEKGIITKAMSPLVRGAGRIKIDGYTVTL